jgi:hypothetical protein
MFLIVEENVFGKHSLFQSKRRTFSLVVITFRPQKDAVLLVTEETKPAHTHCLALF